MIPTKGNYEAFSLRGIAEAGKLYPFVYVFFNGPHVETRLARLSLDLRPVPVTGSQFC